MKQEEKKMNSEKEPEFVPGPPGTGKTHRWLKNKYTGFLQESTWDRIVVLSHTNTAAKEIPPFIIKGIIRRKNTFYQHKLSNNWGSCDGGDDLVQ